jgi:inositol-hexakisphosphate kinase
MSLALILFQVYQKDTGDFFRCNKYSAATITKDTIHESFYRFLYNGVRLRLEIIDPIVEKIRAILMAVARRNDIRLFSSSLMIIYESNEYGVEEKDTMQREKSGNYSGINGFYDQLDSLMASTSTAGHSAAEKTNSAEGLVDVKMIDFAHSFHTASINDIKFAGPDVGYIFGLENLVKVFLNIKERYSAS